MRRMKILGLVALLAIPFGGAQALGLGNVETRSVLNQPFEGRIPIVQATADEIDSLTVHLAGNDQFVRAGIDRAPVLSQLRFEIKQSGKGADYIRISTHDPIAEPFLNFLVEVNWAKGRLIREYTVLLDPPLYVPTQRLSAAQPTITSGGPAVTGAAGGGESWRSTEQPIYYPHGHIGGMAMAGGGGVSGVPAAGAETLWSAAAALRPDESVSMAQMMLALLKANPDAFINGNVNLLKRGYISKLTVPDHQALTAVSREDALAEVKRQHELWQEYRQGGAKTLPPQTAVETAAAPASESKEGAAPEKSPENTAAAGGESDQAKLKLLAAKEGGEAQAGEAMALTKEQLASKERENEELRSQLVESQQLVDTLKSRIALQDNQLAELQAKLSQPQAPAPAPPAPAPAEEVKLPPPATVAPAPEQKPAAPAPAAEQPAAAEQKAEQKPEQKPTEAAPAESKEAAAEPSKEKKKRPPHPAGEKKARVPSGPTWMDEALTTLSGIWDNVRDALGGITGSLQGVASSLSGLIPKTVVDTVPGGLPALLGGVMLALAVLVALIRGIARRARSTGTRPAARRVERAVSDTDETIRAAGETTDYGQDITRDRADQTEIPGGAPDEEAADKTQIALPPGTAGAPPAAEEDPLSEVNVYLAYERFDEAEKVVKAAIAKYPNEHKYKLRLLEVYYAASNKVGYENAARALKNAVGEGGPLWDSALAMWREMSPDRELFAAGGAEAAIPAGGARQFVDITGASVGETGALSDTVMMAPGAVPAAAPKAGEAGIDIDLGVGGSTGATTTAENAVLDLTAAQMTPEDALSLTAADSTGVLDLSGGGVESPAALSPDLSSTVDKSLGGAPPAGEDLLDVTKSGMGQTLGATPAGMDDLLDVTKSGMSHTLSEEPAGMEDLLNVSMSKETSRETPKEDDHVLEFDIGGGAPAAEPDEIEVKAPAGDDNSLEFDLGTAAAGTPDDGGLGLELSDSGKEDTSLSLEDLAESAGELTLDVSGGGATPESAPATAATTTRGLSLDAGGGDGLDLDLSLEGEGSSLDDLTKSMEETVAGMKPEGTSATVLPALDLSLEAPAEEKGVDFDSTQEIAHDALAKARTQADVGNEQTVVMPRSAPVDAQTAVAEVDTKLSLAKAYIELGDSAGARTILNEVVSEGNATQKAEAQRLLQTI